MPKTKRHVTDAYGNYLWDYYKHNIRLPELVERSDGYLEGGSSFESGYGGAIYFADYQDWPAYEKKAAKYAKGKVLDIGCGAGRYALHFQNQGLDVTAIDISPLSIKVCRDRGVKKTRVLAINQIHQLLPHKFDTVLLMGNNLGLLGSYHHARRLLRKMYEITSEGAIIVADATDPYMIDDPSFKIYMKENVKKNRMPGQLRIRVRYKTLRGPWLDYLLASKEELTKILSLTGWALTKTIEGNRENGAYIAIIQKA